jgi:hypothetical protein
MRRAGPAVVATLLVIVVAAFFVPRLTKTRRISFGTPVPQPAAAPWTLFPLPPRSTACLDSVAVEPGRQDALFGVETYGRAGPRLLFFLRGVHLAWTVGVTGGYGTGELTIPFEGPPQSTLTIACIRNLGREPVALRGTTEPRSLSRPRLTIDGRAVEGEVSLAFASAAAESPVDVAATVIGRVTAFKPTWVGSWLVAALLAVVALGAAVGPLLALRRAGLMDEGERRSTDASGANRR